MGCPTASVSSWWWRKLATASRRKCLCLSVDRVVYKALAIVLWFELENVTNSIVSRTGLTWWPTGKQTGLCHVRKEGGNNSYVRQLPSGYVADYKCNWIVCGVTSSNCRCSFNKKVLKMILRRFLPVNTYMAQSRIAFVLIPIFMCILFTKHRLSYSERPAIVSANLASASHSKYASKYNLLDRIGDGSSEPAADHPECSLGT